MDEHLGYEKHAPESVQFDNSRNGKSRKTVKSKSGTLEIEVPEIAMEPLSQFWYPNESEY